MSDAADSAPNIRTRQNLARFIRELANDFRSNPDDWENDTLDSFLEALAAWTDEMDGYYRNMNEDAPVTPQRKTIADMLMSASVYE
ncbi:MAG: hypothetical protein RIR41_1197 [Pseudomonadota bacterium]|jgi:hypothetical protein